MKPRSILPLIVDTMFYQKSIVVSTNYFLNHVLKNLEFWFTIAIYLLDPFVPTTVSNQLWWQREKRRKCANWNSKTNRSRFEYLPWYVSVSLFSTKEKFSKIATPETDLTKLLTDNYWFSTRQAIALWSARNKLVTRVQCHFDVSSAINFNSYR